MKSIFRMAVVIYFLGFGVACVYYEVMFDSDPNKSSIEIATTPIYVKAYKAFLWPYFLIKKSGKHNNSENDEWSKQLELDMKVCVYFFNEVTKEDPNVYLLNKGIDEFSARISKYPTEKKQFLMDGCRKFISYDMSLSEDGLAQMDAYLKTGEFNVTTSPLTKQLETELINVYKLKDEIESIRKELDMQSKQMNDKSAHNFSESEIEDLKSTLIPSMNQIKAKSESDFKRIFKSLFNEEL